MATIRLVPSTYSVSSSSYVSVTNPSNMYNNTDNSTYATVTTSNNSTTSYYIYLKGFNLSDIPTGATINSFTIKVKAYESSLSTSNLMYLTNGTTTTNNTGSAPTTSVSTITFNSVSSTWDTLSGYGSNLGIRICIKRSSRNTKGYLYIYGAEILVDYTLPITTYRIESSITNGTMVSDNPMTVNEGDTALIMFNGDSGYDFQSMTVNGVSVTPSLNETYTVADVTATITTNYEENNTNYITNAYDGNTSTYFWSNEVQTAGRYILFTFSDYIDLNSFSVSTTTSTTDYPCSGTVLQVSSDSGTTWTDIGSFTGSVATSTFPNLNQKKINAIRMYWNNSSGYWICINEITIDYSTHTDDYEYIYAISNVSEDTFIIIIFGKNNQLYVKRNNEWMPVTAYQKINDTWVEITYEYDSSKALVHKGFVN